MKLVNISFYPIRPHEMDFVLHRHESDVKIFARFARAGRVLHVKHFCGKVHVPDRASNEKFFPASESFFALPWKTLKWLSDQRPDIVFVHSFIFPFQVLLMRWMLPSVTRYIIQHHAERPFSNPVKRFFQKRAYRRADLYLFTARDLARSFVINGIVGDQEKVMELMEMSSGFEPTDKEQARQKLGVGPGMVLLWVGRLNANKDPLTVLRALAMLRSHRSDFIFYMLYGEAEMERDAKTLIREENLQEHVVMVGRRSNDELRLWFSAADYYVSASYYESYGMALCEAMACGCTPVVTDIPSFRTMTRNGACGYLYKPGDAKGLAKLLAELLENPSPALDETARTIFREDLSYEALAVKLDKKIEEIL